MTTTTVELRNIADGDDVRTAHARREDDGSVIVEGRDEGPSVQQFFGPDAIVYEWGVRVPADQIPAMMDALDQPGADPLAAVSAWFTGETRAFEPYLDAHDVVHESWSHVNG